MFLKILSHPYWFAITALVVFCLGVLINYVLEVPAEGAQRLLAFIPLGILAVLKGWSMTKE